MVKKEKKFVAFIDKRFEQYCVENFDLDGDGKISEEEALKVLRIDCSCNEIESLDGLEYFRNLTYLDCSANNIKGLCIKNEKLEFLDCSSCDIDYLCVRLCPNLRFLNMSQNPYYCEWLDLHYNTQLEELHIYECISVLVLVDANFCLHSLEDYMIDDDVEFLVWTEEHRDLDVCPFCMDEESESDD